MRVDLFGYHGPVYRERSILCGFPTARGARALPAASFGPAESW